MKKFIVLYLAPQSVMEKMANASPEDAKKGLDAWMVWSKKCGAGLVDMGAPLGSTMKVNKSGASAAQTDICGYSILQAEDLGKATEMVKDHPHLQMDGCEIEVHETMPIHGM